MTAQVLSIHAGRSSDFGTTHTQYQKMDTTTGTVEPQTPISPDGDESRGRRRDREEAESENIGDGADGNDVPGSSRKRRRSKKGSDKKFECPDEGCGKSYSRAEHLYRHQLNRKSEIFNTCSVVHGSLNPAAPYVSKAAEVGPC